MFQRSGVGLVLAAIAGLAVSGGTSALAQTNYLQLVPLRGVPPEPSGGYPTCKLLEASDGRLYGATEEGGSNGAGSVFTAAKDGSGYATLHNFYSSFTEGAAPYDGLVEGTNGALY